MNRGFVIHIRRSDNLSSYFVVGQALEQGFNVCGGVLLWLGAVFPQLGSMEGDDVWIGASSATHDAHCFCLGYLATAGLPGLVSMRTSPSQADKPTTVKDEQYFCLHERVLGLRLRLGLKSGLEETKAKVRARVKSMR